jgi:hypothetical protein
MARGRPGRASRAFCCCGCATWATGCWCCCAIAGSPAMPAKSAVTISFSIWKFIVLPSEVIHGWRRCASGSRPTCRKSRQRANAEEERMDRNEARVERDAGTKPDEGSAPARWSRHGRGGPIRGPAPGAADDRRAGARRARRCRRCRRAGHGRDRRSEGYAQTPKAPLLRGVDDAATGRCPASPGRSRRARRRRRTGWGAGPRRRRPGRPRASRAASHGSATAPRARAARKAPGRPRRRARRKSRPTTPNRRA